MNKINTIVAISFLIISGAVDATYSQEQEGSEVERDSLQLSEEALGAFEVDESKRVSTQEHVRNEKLFGQTPKKRNGANTPKYPIPRNGEAIKKYRRNGTPNIFESDEIIKATEKAHNKKPNNN